MLRVSLLCMIVYHWQRFYIYSGSADRDWETTDGWYNVTYGAPENNGSSIGADGNPKPWVDYNARKIDCVRHKIDDMFPHDCIDKSVLLLSLMLGVSRISNWMGHQTGYFKDWKKGKLRPIRS